MSTSNQNNGKKCISNNNSATNTPSNTPISSIVNPSNNQCSIQSNTSLTNAPKYGTLVPNRIFVGGISANTTEAELMQLFNNYGTVKAAKIIQDRAGVSKGYGFITFESEEEAKRLQRESDNIVLRERKLNIAPAIKKQPFNRVYDASSPPTITPGGPAQYFIPAGGVPFYQGGVTYYTQAPPPQPNDMNAQQAPVYQAPTVYPTQSAGPPQSAAYPPIVYPTQPMYMPQQFPYQPVPYDYNYHPNGSPQYIVGNQSTHQPSPLQMPSPGSPPRTPCYNSQLPYGPDVMYFNMPLYGSVDSAPVYQDSVDASSGNLSEDSNVGILQELEASRPLSNTNSTLDNSSTPDVNRQCATPVVSLLSLDERQEKDLTALQGGRRKKSFDTSLPNNSFQFNPNECCPVYPNSNDFRNNYPQINNEQQISYQNTVTYTLPVNDYPSRFSSNSPTTAASFRNHNNNIVQSTWYSGRYRQNGEGSSYGNQESTFASGLDENRNEEKYSTPPPYSSRYSGNMYNTHFPRKYQNSNRSSWGRFPNFNSTRPTNSYTINRNSTSAQFSTNKVHRYNQNFATTNYNGCVDSADSSINGESISIADDPSLSENSDPPSHPISPLPSQMTPTSQNCIPSTRRARRNVRRSTHMGAPMTEIGAGDAPIPATDVGDTCKKLDNLKL